MTITISPEVEAKAREKAAAEGLSVEAYVEQLILGDGWVELYEPEVDKSDPEFAEIQAAVNEGLEEAERGEGQPIEEFFAEFRAKRGLSR